MVPTGLAFGGTDECVRRHMSLGGSAMSVEDGFPTFERLKVDSLQFSTSEIA
jgi:hypothetical protein